MFFDHILNWSHLVNKNVCTVRKFKIFKYLLLSICVPLVCRESYFSIVLLYTSVVIYFIFFFLLIFIKKKWNSKKNYLKERVFFVFFLNQNNFLFKKIYSDGKHNVWFFSSK
jgi:hypothetical protein